MATPYIRTTALESLHLQFWQTLIWSSLIYTLSASLSDSMPGSREEIFLKKCINFKLFTPKLSPLMDGSGNLQFLVSLPYRCYIPNFVKFDPVVLKNNGGCQPIAIGHLSYSSTSIFILKEQRENTQIKRNQTSDKEDVSQSPDGDTYSREDEVTTMYLNNNKHTYKYSLLITQSLQHTYTHIYTVTHTDKHINIHSQGTTRKYKKYNKKSPCLNQRFYISLRTTKGPARGNV